MLVYILLTLERPKPGFVAMFTVAVDVGGTFTDSVVLDSKGHVTIAKDLSTPPDFSEGVFRSVENAAIGLGLDDERLLKQTSLFLHSTTVAENAIVTGKGAKVGLITTSGFEDTVLMTRAGYGRWSGLTEDELKRLVHTDKPVPLVVRSLIRGVKERTDYKGRVLAQVDSSEVARVIQHLVQDGAESIGVCFLWSFMNPSNELAVKKIIEDSYPSTSVTTSGEIAPVLGEYERTSTVVLNSYLTPSVQRYLNNLEEGLRERGFQGSLLLMQAYGGLVSLNDTIVKPIGLIESGPVGGLLGSRFLARLLGESNVIATDMGGTTFKVGAIREGKIDYQREPMVLRYHYLFPKMDVISIAAGGGSVVWIDPRTGIPKVGPASAEAHPGPICYDLGGVDPTLSDVDLILGYLAPEFFLGGRMKLNLDKAIGLFRSKIAEPLSMDVTEAAAAIYKIANSKMYDLLHKVTIERGLDPREFVLFGYGGAAGMHAANYGAELEVSKIIFPYTASVQGAFGLATSDIVYEFIATHPMHIPGDLSRVNRIFEDLREKAVHKLTSEGIRSESIAMSRALDLRFQRQVHVLTTPVEFDDTLSETDLESTCNLFKSLYKQRYGEGSTFEEAAIEIITFRLRATGHIRKPALAQSSSVDNTSKVARIFSRKVYFEKSGGLVPTNFYDLDRLRSGNEIAGPAVILTPVTTIVVNPDQNITVDAYKNVVLEP